MIEIIVTGSREFFDWRLLFSSLHPYSKSYEGLLLKYGDAKTGTDLYTDMYAEATQCNFQKWDAEWKKFHKGSGIIRNHAMVDSGANLVLGFPTDRDGGPSKGTKDCCEYAWKKGIYVKFPEMEQPGAPEKGWWKWARELRHED